MVAREPLILWGGSRMLRVVVAGAGFMGATHAPRWAAQEDVRVVGVYSRSLARAAGVAEPLGARATDDLAALLQMDADAVDICLPTDRHPEVACSALAAGRHVVCEKPIALRIDDAERMAAAARAADRLLLVAHVVRFWPEYARLFELVRDGAIGRPTSAVAQRLQEGPGWAADSATTYAHTGGQVVDLQIHDDDYLMWLFGMPRQVFAQGSQRHMLTTFAFDGVTATAEAAADMPPGYPFTSTVRVRGEGGVLEYVFRAGGARPDEAGGGVSELTLHRPGRPAERVAVAPGDPYTTQIAHFAECLRRGAPSTVVTPESATRALRVALAAGESLQSGVPVRL